MGTEADTCRTLITPKLQAAGWEQEPHSLAASTGERCRKFYYDGGHVEIAAELVHELDADGKQLRVVKLTDGPRKAQVQRPNPDVLKLPPISNHGTVGAIVGVFGGPDKLRAAVSQLQTLLYTE